MVNAKIVVLPGDGIGPEVVDAIPSQPQTSCCATCAAFITHARAQRVHASPLNEAIPLHHYHSARLMMAHQQPLRMLPR